MVMPPVEYGVLNPEIRDLTLEIAMGNKMVLWYLMEFDKFYWLEHKWNYAPILRWCIDHGYTGLVFIQWITEKHRNDPIRASKEALKYLKLSYPLEIKDDLIGGY